MSCPWVVFNRICADLWFWGGNHLRLGRSTWCTSRARPKLAAFTQFHFDFGHDKATGPPMPLSTAGLNLQRTNHKTKFLSHENPYLRSARHGLDSRERYEHSMAFFEIFRWSLSCGAETSPHAFLCFPWHLPHLAHFRVNYRWLICFDMPMLCWLFKKYTSDYISFTHLL